MWKVKVKSLSHARLLETPWTVAHQAPPSMGIFQARVLEWGAIAFQKQSRFRLICGASTNCWPKTNRLPVLSPTKIRFIPRSARNYNWGFATVVNSMLVPAQQRRELFWRWGEEARVGLAIGGAESSKYSGFSLAECDGLSLAKLLPGKKRRSFFLLLSSALVGEGESSPFWPLGSVLIAGSLYCFYIPTN